MLALIIGLVTVVIGILGLIKWIAPFIYVLKGAVPAMLICGGLLAIIAGITSMKDAAEAKKLEQK